MNNATPWYDHMWLQSAASVFLAIFSVVSVVVIVLQLRALNQKNEFDIDRHLKEQFDRRFAGHTQRNLFELGVRLALESLQRGQEATDSRDPLAQYEENLVRRWVVVSRLSELEYEEALSSVVHPLVNHYNEIARLIEFGIVRSVRFLSTYHLAVIRDLYAVEPFILHQSRRKEQARWGMRVLALAEIARDYHLTNRLHRRPVFLWSRAGDRVVYGLVLCGWKNGRPPIAYRLRSALRSYGRLSEARKDRQERLLDRLERRFSQEEKVQAKVSDHEH